MTTMTLMTTMTVMTEKSGYCPAVLEARVGACQAPDCGVDGHCDGAAKCCTSACGSSVCTKPEPRPSCNTVVRVFERDSVYVSVCLYVCLGLTAMADRQNAML